MVSTHWVGYVCITYSSYLQHLTKGKKKKEEKQLNRKRNTDGQTGEIKSTVGSEAHQRWELKECKWVPTSAQNVNIRHQVSSHHTHMQKTPHSTDNKNEHLFVVRATIRHSEAGKAEWRC